jgi:hypothetical protein
MRMCWLTELGPEGCIHAWESLGNPRQVPFHSFEVIIHALDSLPSHPSPTSPIFSNRNVTQSSSNGRRSLRVTLQYSRLEVISSQETLFASKNLLDHKPIRSYSSFRRMKSHLRFGSGIQPDFKASCRTFLNPCSKCGQRRERDTAGLTAPVRSLSSLFWRLELRISSRLLFSCINNSFSTLWSLKVSSWRSRCVDLLNHSLVPVNNPKKARAMFKYVCTIPCEICAIGGHETFMACAVSPVVDTAH